MYNIFATGHTARLPAFLVVAAAAALLAAARVP